MSMQIVGDSIGVPLALGSPKPRAYHVVDHNMILYAVKEAVPLALFER